MFVKIENYKDPSEYELVDVDDISSVDVPIYTTMATVNTLNRVLCDQGVDTNVRDDN